MHIENTKDITVSKLKVLVHGPSGSGKTRLCGTTNGKNLILSAEEGLLSLRGRDIDFVRVATLDDLRGAYSFLLTDATYPWVSLDSISEIAEKVLTREKSINKDGRMAYGEMAEKTIAIVKDFRDLNKNVYISAKQGGVKDDISGGLYFGAVTPGRMVGPSLPYLFDEVFALHAWKDQEGNLQRALQTGRDTQYDAKDRSGALQFIEQADLGFICNKISTPIIA